MNEQLEKIIGVVLTPGVIALVGWGLKNVVVKLIVTLIETMAKVQMLDAKLTGLIAAVGDVEKIRADQNMLFSKVKKIEVDFDLFNKTGSKS